MTGTWVERPKPPHLCRHPEGDERFTMDWRCECGQTWRYTQHYGDQREPGDWWSWERVRHATSP